MEGKVLSFNISVKKGTVKDSIESCKFIKNMGIEGDSHADGGKRSVSLLAIESLEDMKANGVIGLKHGSFAENITTEGLLLHKLPIGTILKIGEVELKLTQIGKECHGEETGCAIKKQTGKCVMPTQGIFAEVIKGGTCHIGEKIEVIM